MERLTDKNAVGNYFYPKCFEKCDGLGASSKCDNCEIMTSVCEKLGKYEDLEEQNRLVILPCKYGFQHCRTEDWKNCKTIDDVIDKLAEYEGLEEQGRLVKLPCKIGTEVYDITWWDDVQEKVVVKGKAYYRTIHKHKVSKSTFGYTDIEEIGKTVFLTKAEEKILRRPEFRFCIQRIFIHAYKNQKTACYRKSVFEIEEQAGRFVRRRYGYGYCNFESISRPLLVGCVWT